MEMRDIEIFLTLTEELHFGRTAQRLRVTQARVSQAIKTQERRIGARLFDRTSRTVALTPVGKRLRDDLRAGYDAIQAGITRASATSRMLGGVLRLGVMGAIGYELRHVIDLFGQRHPECEVDVREIHFSEPFAGLRNGEFDVVLLWAPIREPDLTRGPVALTEGRVLAVSAGHELASRPSVSLEDLAGLIAINTPDLPAYWIEAMLPFRTPSGRPIARDTKNLRTFHEVLTAIAAGRIVSPLNGHAPLHYSHPGVAYVPIADAPTTEWVLVWRTATETEQIRALVQAVTDLGPRAIPGSHPSPGDSA